MTRTNGSRNWEGFSKRTTKRFRKGCEEKNEISAISVTAYKVAVDILVGVV